MTTKHVRAYLWEKPIASSSCLFCPSRSWWCKRGQWSILLIVVERVGWISSWRPATTRGAKKGPSNLYVLTCPFSITVRIIPLAQQKWPFLCEPTFVFGLNKASWGQKGGTSRGWSCCHHLKINSCLADALYIFNRLVFFVGCLPCAAI